MAHYYNKENGNKEADRSHPRKRKRSGGKSTKGKSCELSPIGVDKPTQADITLKFKKYKCTKQDNSVSDCIPSGLPMSTLAHIAVKSTKQDSLVHDFTPSNVVKSTITNVTAKSTVPPRSHSGEGTSGNNDSENVGEARN